MKSIQQNLVGMTARLILISTAPAPGLAILIAHARARNLSPNMHFLIPQIQVNPDGNLFDRTHADGNYDRRLWNYGDCDLAQRVYI